MLTYCLQLSVLLTFFFSFSFPSSSLEKHNLSFIETSALDSTNVEAAFQNILTGMMIFSPFIIALFCCWESKNVLLSLIGRDGTTMDAWNENEQVLHLEDLLINKQII